MKRTWPIALCALLAGACTSDNASCPRDEPAACPSTPPSYAHDIAPLVEEYCSQCHNPQGSAFDEPISTYADLYSRRVDALDQLYDCEMPMSPAPQPTIADRITLLTWFVCGAPDN